MMWNANLGLSLQAGYKQPPWELKPPPHSPHPPPRTPGWMWSLRTKSKETMFALEKGHCSGGPSGCQESGLHQAAPGLAVLSLELSQSPQRPAAQACHPGPCFSTIS